MGFQRARYMTLETIAPLSDEPTVQLTDPPPVNAAPRRHIPRRWTRS